MKESGALLNFNVAFGVVRSVITLNFNSHIRDEAQEKCGNWQEAIYSALAGRITARPVTIKISKIQPLLINKDSKTGGLF